MGMHKAKQLYYQDNFLTSVADILDTEKKTFIHLPMLRRWESTDDQWYELDSIIDMVGDVISFDPKTHIIDVIRKDKVMIKVADLTSNDMEDRNSISNYLRNISCANDIDLIIARGANNVVFDWPFCEHVITIGERYRDFLLPNILYTNLILTKNYN